MEGKRERKEEGKREMGEGRVRGRKPGIERESFRWEVERVNPFIH